MATMAAGTVKKPSKRNYNWNNLFGKRLKQRREQEQQRRHSTPAPSVPAPVKPAVHRFSPSLAAACDAARVAYGAVGVEGQPAHVRSYEMRLDQRDGSCFLPRDHRDARHVDRPQPAADKI